MRSILLLFATSSHLSAATVLLLPGTSETGFWSLNSTNYHSGTNPSYPVSGSTSTPWGGPIAASSTSATFTRIAGGGYFIGSGSGIYGGFSPASYAVGDSAPLPDLETLIFQARMNLAPTSITLSINGGAGLAADFFLSSPAGSGSFGPISDFAWQWDLRAVSDPINSYQITINLPENSLIYGNQPDLTSITAGDRFVQAIPEPSVPLSVIVGLAFTLTRRRRA